MSKRGASADLGAEQVSDVDKLIAAGYLISNRDGLTSPLMTDALAAMERWQRGGSAGGKKSASKRARNATNGARVVSVRAETVTLNAEARPKRKLAH